MNKYKNLANNMIVFAANTFATKLVTFILVPLYTANMTAEEFGVTDMSLTVITLLFPVLTLDIAEAAVRYIIAKREKDNIHVFITLGIVLVSGVAAILLSPLLSLPVFGGLGNYRTLFLLAYFSTALFNACSETSRGLGQLKLIPLCAVLSSATTLSTAYVQIVVLQRAVAGYFISVSLGPTLAILVYLSAGGLFARFIDGARECVFEKSGLKKTLKCFKDMLRYSLPLIPNSIFWWLSSGINRFFITGIIGIAASGLFAAASKIPNLLNIAYSIFLQAWQLTAFLESEKGSLDRFFSIGFCGVQFVTISSCAALMLVSPFLAQLLLQGEMYDSWGYIGILLLSNLFNVFASFYGTIYSTAMRTPYILNTTVVGAIAGIVITPLSLRMFGLIGAAVSSLISQMVVYAMRVADSKKFIKVKVSWWHMACSIILLAIAAVLMLSRPSDYSMTIAPIGIAVIAIQVHMLCVFLKIELGIEVGEIGKKKWLERKK